MWSLDKNSTLPFYQQITNQIIQAIQQGELMPGDKLPPERTLAKSYGVNRSTIVRALEELVSFGWITRRQGSGTLVAEGRWGSRQLQLNPWRSLLTSPFLREDPYLTELKKRQAFPDSLDLFTGDLPAELIPDFEFPAITWEQILKEEKRITTTGYLPLKEAIIKHLEKQLQLPTQNQDLLITSGSTQGMALLMQVLLETGDFIATEEPSFLFALPLFSSLGIHLVGVKQDKEGMSIADLELAIQTKKIKLLYLNPNYQNPTGKTMSLKRRQEILDLCKNYRLPIIEDDVFSDLNFSEHLPSLKKLAPEQVIYLGSLSKRFSSSIKIGWLLAPKSLIDSLAQAKKRMENDTDLFPQLLASAALTSSNYLDQQLALIKELQNRSQAFEKCLQSFTNDWDYHPIQGGLYYWLTWKRQRLTRKDWNVFLEENLLLAPSFLFSNDTMAMRINYTRMSPEEIPLFQERLEQATKKIRKEDFNEPYDSTT
ncbi:PLP-dependent aminotransferase family protein [Enterococcus lemanii]|uniref:PLP-dependent aminotransferase family protein n=1 Tax=Enterococcus lemanii TaxID=1159752 RepID=A0ABV9MTF1_9ENTE|nr:PLP-dependent aminotransferase family protein [Enterococcus lemanii]